MVQNQGQIFVDRVLVKRKKYYVELLTFTIGDYIY